MFGAEKVVVKNVIYRRKSLHFLRLSAESRCTFCDDIYRRYAGSCEIDFMLDNGEMVIPLEVKAEENLQAKSLKTFREKFSPEISVRTSMSEYRKEEWMINIPLYMIGEISNILKLNSAGSV